MKSTERAFDGLLVQRCKGDDKKAYSLLVKRWHHRFCKQAYWYTKDIDLAKDIAQDSWTAIFKKLDNLKDPNSFGSWALSIVNRKSIDTLRKVNRTSEKLKDYSESLKTNDNQIDKNTIDYRADIGPSRSRLIIKAIRGLPKNQQIVLRLFYVEDYSIFEISKLLKISKGTVKSRLFYAREKLKTLVKNRNHEK